MNGLSTPVAEATRVDLAALQGTWEQVACEEDGVADPPDAYCEAGTCTMIEGLRFRVCGPDGHRLLEGRFELDATTRPRSIVWIDAIGPEQGQRLLGIYRLDGDSFTFVAADAGMPPPTRFGTVPGWTMRRFVRRSLAPMRA